MPAGVRARRRGWGARTPGASAPADQRHMVLKLGGNKCQMMKFCWQSVQNRGVQITPDKRAFLASFVRVMAAYRPTRRKGIEARLIHAEDAELAEDFWDLYLGPF